ncbi:hypothetical protein ABIF62_004861 [Bradyrhizobium japonicum]
MATARVLSWVCVEAGVGLGDGEARLLAALDHRRQHALALLLGAEHDHGIEPEHVDVHRRGTGHAGTGFRDGAHHDRGFGDAEPRAAIGFGHADAEPAGVRQRLVEVVREAAVMVLLQPIGVGKTFADLCDSVANGFLLIGEREIHDGLLVEALKRNDIALEFFGCT